jgi:hypothetical protein
VVFAPLLGRIPPTSGGWHRDLFSGSVAGASKTRSLLILTQSYNGARRQPIVREYGWYRSSGTLDYADAAHPRETILEPPRGFDA